MYNLAQKLLAEFIGTFTFVFIGAGSVCAEQYLRAGSQSSFGLLGIALAHGLAFGIMVFALGHVSGGNFNPAITMAFWATKKMGTVQSVLYGIAQLLGAIAAAYFLRAVLPDSAWRPVFLGTPDLAADFTRLQGILLEAVMTFLLVLVMFAAAADSKGSFHRTAGFAIGLTITMDMLVGGPLTGAAMNPARALGPALAARHWANDGVYWVGPLLGGVIAGWVYDKVFLRET